MNKDKVAKRIAREYENIIIQDNVGRHHLIWNGEKFKETGLDAGDRFLWKGYDFLCSFENFRDLGEKGKEGFCVVVFELYEQNNKMHAMRIKGIEPEFHFYE